MGANAEETAARVRAALAYANIKMKEGGQYRAVGGVSASTLARIVSPTNPRGASTDELWAIADACGVPRVFMQAGFSASEDDPAARLDSVEERLEALAVLLPAILDLCGGPERLPAGGARALRRVLDTTTPAGRRSRG